MVAKAQLFEDEGKVPAERLNMSWRDGKNKVDCGIYAIRHMETYMGNGVSDWKCGLKKGDKKQMANLRIKYLYNILTSEHNAERVRVLDIIQQARPKRGPGSRKKN